MVNQDTIREVMKELGRRGGRATAQLLGLQVGQVDLRNNVIRLEPGTTKNKEGRAVVMTPRSGSW